MHWYGSWSNVWFLLEWFFFPICWKVSNIVADTSFELLPRTGLEKKKKRCWITTDFEYFFLKTTQHIEKFFLRDLLYLDQDVLFFLLITVLTPFQSYQWYKLSDTGKQSVWSHVRIDWLNMSSLFCLLMLRVTNLEQETTPFSSFNNNSLTIKNYTRNLSTDLIPLLEELILYNAPYSHFPYLSWCGSMRGTGESYLGECTYS